LHESIGIYEGDDESALDANKSSTQQESSIQHESSIRFMDKQPNYLAWEHNF
jgi:hypothetical protein